MTDEEYIAAADLAKLYLLTYLLAGLTAGSNPSIPVEDVTSIERVVDGWTVKLQARISKMRHGA